MVAFGSLGRDPGFRVRDVWDRFEETLAARNGPR
jgi:hypothetical protein